MGVLSVTEDQQPNLAGELIDVYIVTFTIGDRAGTFTATVPKGANAVATAENLLAAEAAQVNALYGINP